MKTRHLLLCGLLMGAVALSGCRVFRNSCEAPPTAEEVATLPALKTPEGTAAPDTRNALKIPDVAVADTVRSKSDPCLEEPPMYSPGWKPDEKAQEVKPGDVPAVEGETKKRRWWWPFGRG